MKIKSYRLKHLGCIFMYVWFCILQFCKPGLISNIVCWGCMITGLALMSNNEKEDELARQTLSKATNITFYILIVSLFLIGVIGLNVNWEFMRSELYSFLAITTFVIRSAVYLVLDRPEKIDMENE